MPVSRPLRLLISHEANTSKGADHLVSKLQNHWCVCSKITHHAETNENAWTIQQYKDLLEMDALILIASESMQPNLWSMGRDVGFAKASNKPVATIQINGNAPQIISDIQTFQGTNPNLIDELWQWLSHNPITAPVMGCAIAEHLTTVPFLISAKQDISLLDLIQHWNKPGLEQLKVLQRRQNINKIETATKRLVPDHSSKPFSHKTNRPPQLSLFLSYQGKVENKAEEFAKALNEPSWVHCFHAPSNIAAMTQWRNELLDGLARTDALVILLSPEYTISQWTGLEVGYAIARQCPILVIEDTHIPAALNSFTQITRTLTISTVQDIFFELTKIQCTAKIMALVLSQKIVKTSSKAQVTRELRLLQNIENIFPKLAITQ